MNDKDSERKQKLMTLTHPLRVMAQADATEALDDELFELALRRSPLKTAAS